MDFIVNIYRLTEEIDLIGPNALTFMVQSDDPMGEALLWELERLSIHRPKAAEGDRTSTSLVFWRNPPLGWRRKVRRIIRDHCPGATIKMVKHTEGRQSMRTYQRL